MSMIRRKYHRRFSSMLTYHEQYQVACSIMNGVKPKVLCQNWSISQSYVSTIKTRFLAKILVWQPHVLERFKGSESPVQAIDFSRYYGTGEEE